MQITLAPKQFSKMAEGSDDFLVLVFASNFVSTWVILLLAFVLGRLNFV